MRRNALVCNSLIFASLGLTQASVCSAGDTLTSGQYIDKVRTLVSAPMGYYTLRMLPDGTLVILRNDGSLRYKMASGGDFAIMQGDGNFVQYKHPWQPLWWTGTHNGQANSVTIHDDGDIVVYSPGPTRKKVWNLGSDYIWGNPSKVGDVVGGLQALIGMQPSF